MRKRVGCIFGSFDPITIGHISMATQALNNGLVDKVLFVPAKQNPWKEKSTDYNIRCTLINSAIGDISDIELSRAENELFSQYTYDVIKNIENRLRYDEELCIVTTNETVDEISKWYNGDRILKDYNIVLVDMPINIHSTDIRNMIREDKNPLPYITKEVWRLIKSYNLYKE